MEKRRGAVLNQIMRKFLGEDDVIALREEIFDINNLRQDFDMVKRAGRPKGVKETKPRQRNVR